MIRYFLLKKKENENISCLFKTHGCSQKVSEISDEKKRLGTSLLQFKPKNPKRSINISLRFENPLLLCLLHKKKTDEISAKERITDC